MDQDEKFHEKCLFNQKEQKTINILVLGMINILPDQYDSRSVGRQSTYPPPLRDFYRLEALQMLIPNAIIYTLNQQPVSGIQENQNHVFAKINRRGAQTLAQTFPNIWFKYVLLDYMRFPSTYMVEAYGNICAKYGFIETLYQEGLFTLETEIFLPHLKNKDPFCNDTKEWKLKNTLPFSNPLVAATSCLQVHSPQCLGGLENEKELALLDPHSPFTKVMKKC